jgi:hypothetical protein
MAIRIRTVNGVTLALCAAETDPKRGDVYLDDDKHYALTMKFALDFKQQGGITEDSGHDPWILEAMLNEKKRDAKDVLQKTLSRLYTKRRDKRRK